MVGEELGKCGRPWPRVAGRHMVVPMRPRPHATYFLDHAHAPRPSQTTPLLRSDSGFPSGPRPSQATPNGHTHSLLGHAHSQTRPMHFPYRPRPSQSHTHTPLFQVTPLSDRPRPSKPYPNAPRSRRPRPLSSHAHTSLPDQALLNPFPSRPHPSHATPTQQSQTAFFHRFLSRPRPLKPHPRTTLL